MRIAPAVLAASPLAILLLLWTYSYIPDGTHVRSEGGWVYAFFVPNGSVPFYRSRPAAAALEQVRNRPAPAGGGPVALSLPGLRCVWGRSPSGLLAAGAAVAYPYFLLPSLLPFLWLRRHLRRKSRAAAGHCLGCGYDLRGSRDTCPECGRDSQRSDASAGTIAVAADAH